MKEIKTLPETVLRKGLLVTLLILFSTLKIFAAENVLFSDRPGYYAIYDDLRFENEAFIGVCYAGENTIIARSYEPVTENELILMIELVLNDNEIDLGQNLKILKGDLNSSLAAKRLLPMIMNWATTWYKSKDKIKENSKYSVSTDDDYNYASWIPVFQIDTIGKKEKFSVVSMGMIKDFSDERFFEFSKLPEVIESDKYKINKGKEIEVIIDDLKVPLDSNWKTEDNRVYRITNKTPQDAAFIIETLNYIEAGLTSMKELAKLLLVGNMDIVLLSDGSYIELDGEIYNIQLRMYDPEQKKITIQQTQLIDRGDGYVSIASLACYETKNTLIQFCINSKHRFHKLSTNMNYL